MKIFTIKTKTINKKEEKKELAKLLFNPHVYKPVFRSAYLLRSLTANMHPESIAFKMLTLKYWYHF